MGRSCVTNKRKQSHKNGTKRKSKGQKRRKGRQKWIDSAQEDLK